MYELREKILSIIMAIECMTYITPRNRLRFADQILALPKIKDGLTLLEIWNNGELPALKMDDEFWEKARSDKKYEGR
jgi:hypothetical protein